MGGEELAFDDRDTAEKCIVVQLNVISASMAGLKERLTRGHPYER